MANITIQPVKFIIKGTELEVRFIGEDDEFQWYKGIVQDINFYGEDDNGTFINCKILYEDGELIDETILYNINFNDDDSIDAWRFVGDISMLISYMINTVNELTKLKADLKIKKNNIKRLIRECLQKEDFEKECLCYNEEEEEDDEEDEDEEEEDEEYEEEEDEEDEEEDDEDDEDEDEEDDEDEEIYIYYEDINKKTLIDYILSSIGSVISHTIVAGVSAYGGYLLVEYFKKK